jgi:hypothetical protein
MKKIDSHEIKTFTFFLDPEMIQIISLRKYISAAAQNVCQAASYTSSF